MNKTSGVGGHYHDDSLLLREREGIIVCAGNAEIGTGDHGTTVSVSVAAFRAKLELLGAELAAQGMFPESSPPATKVGGASKLDARRTDAVRYLLYASTQ